jgi:hypothetical protein
MEYNHARNQPAHAGGNNNHAEGGNMTTTDYRLPDPEPEALRRMSELVSDGQSVGDSCYITARRSLALLADPGRDAVHALDGMIEHLNGFPNLVRQTELLDLLTRTREILQDEGSVATQAWLRSIVADYEQRALAGGRDYELAAADLHTADMANNHQPIPCFGCLAIVVQDEADEAEVGRMEAEGHIRLMTGPGEGAVATRIAACSAACMERVVRRQGLRPPTQAEVNAYNRQEVK